MAQPYSTGPALVYAGIGSGYAPVFFGTAKAGLLIEDIPEWDQVHNDLTGTKHPYDKIYEGEVSIVRGEITRWNEAVLELMQDRTYPARGNTLGPGIDPPGAIGTLMVTEGAAFPLWIQYLYGSGATAKPAMNTMPGGRHFFAAELEGPDVRKTGTGENSIQCVWFCGRVFSPLLGTVACYDGNMQGLPSFN